MNALRDRNSLLRQQAIIVNNCNYTPPPHPANARASASTTILRAHARNAAELRNEVLSRGNSRDPAESYVAFRGRMPMPGHCCATGGWHDTSWPAGRGGTDRPPAPALANPSLAQWLAQAGASSAASARYAAG